MRKREIFWIGVLLLLGWAYVHFFTGVGVTRRISIVASLRQPRGRATDSVYPVFFVLDGGYPLTSVKVTITDTNQAKPQERIIWHLVAKEGSPPVKYFSYGQSINGMVPNIQGIATEPLTTNVIYHLEISAGKLKGATDFQTKAMPH